MNSNSPNNSPRVNYRLNETQRKELQARIDRFQQDGHYGAAYHYLYNTVPHDTLRGRHGTSIDIYSYENAAIRKWFDVAASTNSHSGDRTDLALRAITKEVMNQRGIGNEYSDKKYNEFSNRMAERLLNNIAETGEISREKIIKGLT